MSISAYNGFFISARAVVAPIGGSRTPMIKISATAEGDAIMCLYSTGEFSTDKDAEADGIQMGKKWIDGR